MTSNPQAILNILERIRLPDDLAWRETLEIHADALLEISDVNDDLTREVEFYDQALNALKSALPMMKEAGMPFVRPKDMYAEMVKSDIHMSKVKRKLLVEKRKIDAVEDHRKRSKELKHSKQKKAKKEEAKAKLKKQTLKAIDSLKGKKDEQLSTAKIDAVLEAVGKKTISKKRVFKDQKYGRGQKNSNRKRNTSESTNAPYVGQKYKKRKKSQQNRPGKRTRHQQ